MLVVLSGMYSVSSSVCVDSPSYRHPPQLDVLYLGRSSFVVEVLYLGRSSFVRGGSPLSRKEFVRSWRKKHLVVLVFCWGGFKPIRYLSIICNCCVL